MLTKSVSLTFGRPAKMHGVPIDSTMDVNTWAAFAGSHENAVLEGDFAVTENELRRPLKSLREAGINIVAIHSRMISEEPRIIFFHYWGRFGSKPRPKYSESVTGHCWDTGKTAGECEVRTSASVTRYVKIL
jgi:hypothetical protein